MDPNAVKPYYDQLNTIYDPQRQLIQQQQAALPQQMVAQTSALDQAKVNAFRDITNASNTRGMYFSGFRPSQEARYTGETYLPALAKLQQEQVGQQTALQQALNTLYGNQQTQAMGLYDTAQQRAEQKRQWEAEQAMKESQFQQELAASRSSGGGGSYSSGAVVDPYKGFTTKPSKNGGTNFFGPGNQPITAAQYYQATGGGISALAGFLQNSNAKGAYKDLNSGKLSPAQLTEKYPYIFGGV